MGYYRKTDRKRKGPGRTYLRRRRPDQMRVRELKDAPWWCEPSVQRALADMDREMARKRR
jgi:hypothetical protein